MGGRRGRGRETLWIYRPARCPHRIGDRLPHPGARTRGFDRRARRPGARRHRTWGRRHTRLHRSGSLRRQEASKVGAHMHFLFPTVRGRRVSGADRRVRSVGAAPSARRDVPIAGR